MIASYTISIAFLFMLIQIFTETLCQQCINGGSEESFLGWKLQNHVYKTLKANFGYECVLICRQDSRCQSFNWVISLNMCEFSDRTKEARPEDFLPDPERYYYRRDRNRVPLGSTPELPAETCKEIKASEGEAESKKYWLSTIKPGSTVLAHCDMKTEDVDECTASSPVCDVNAQCSNTRGSYSCKCKVGYSGSGKTCKDINECAANSDNCDVNALCQNTVGSHTCLCKAGYTGNGKQCRDINECTANSDNCDVNAVCQNTAGSHTCLCKAGYTGNGKQCRDIDECTASSPLCDVNAQCSNTRGSYSCRCKVGFSGNGKTCKDINECTTNSHSCDVKAVCQNTAGSHTCSCKAGYKGDGNTCYVPFSAVFTNLGASGRLGPTSLGSYYSGQDHDGQVTLQLHSGIQQWTVPQTGNYRIEAIGAAGGYDNYNSNSRHYRGRGARMKGTFRLSRGETIQILVGQEGGINNVANTAGGGGGSFVVKGSSMPLIIAGGGGGIEALLSRRAGCDASTGTAGRAGYKSWSGGSGGQGATTADSSNSGGGGGGFFSSGRSSTQFGGSMGNGGEGGKGFLQGGVGGRARVNNAVGGFGGGGGAYGDGGGAGGGGGYSGESSGENKYDSCGGGGGSYNAGKNQQNECCYNTAGHGQVTITLM